jgi:predicted nucleic acid-binding protein
VTPPRRLVLDTDVLFSRVYHETYGRLGAEGVVIVIWSDAILAELERVLIEHGRSPRHAEAVCNFVRAGFPGSHVEPKSGGGAAFVSDTADAHIAAAALAGRAEAIVTRNRLDYRATELLELGIALVDPVDHLTATADAYPKETRSAIIRQAAASTPPRTPAELLDLFRERVSGSQTASRDPSPAPNQPAERVRQIAHVPSGRECANPASRGGLPGMGDATVELATSSLSSLGRTA